MWCLDIDSRRLAFLHTIFTLDGKSDAAVKLDRYKHVISNVSVLAEQQERPSRVSVALHRRRDRHKHVVSNVNVLAEKQERPSRVSVALHRRRDKAASATAAQEMSRISVWTHILPLITASVALAVQLGCRLSYTIKDGTHYYSLYKMLSLPLPPTTVYNNPIPILNHSLAEINVYQPLDGSRNFSMFTTFQRSKQLIVRHHPT
ncbi:hypothetical protein J6590_012119 [Homalodisca vitripennis]|nr:hypothetical protein J6590_012119 [Homalodisca vitripennis]